MDIMVVDDEVEVRSMIYDMLKSKGHNVIVAENGKRAIDLLAFYKVDIIVTDIIMPEIEGIEFILRLRQSNIPIISISALSKEAVVLEFMDSLGIVGILQKPFAKSDLMQLVDNVKENLDKKQLSK